MGNNQANGNNTANGNAQDASTKVITGKVRFSYVSVWEPKSVKGGDAKYSVSIIIPKTDKKTLADIQTAIEVAKEQGAAKFGGRIPANLKLPLRDGDLERPDDAVYAGSYFINANSAEKPGIVDRHVKPIMDRDEFYSGCYGRASLSFYTFNSGGNKGVACWLRNLMKLADGEPLSGRATPGSDFGMFSAEAFEDEEGQSDLDFLN
ncbi:MAG TPA: DUF2815 domain-containing protein [Clostridiales bacterium]|nr:DUF2815 domain-containing protein [Clostridiales bacterium]